MKNKTNYDNYLAIRIIEAIGKSDLLEPDKKIAAIKDIQRMYESANYCGMTDEYVKELLIDCCANTIAFHHCWGYSDLGWEFWSKMNQIIGKV
jgi:hypothetical protein